MKIARSVKFDDSHTHTLTYTYTVTYIAIIRAGRASLAHIIHGKVHDLLNSTILESIHHLDQLGVCLLALLAPA